MAKSISSLAYLGASALLLVGTIAGGLIQGRPSHRWGPRGDSHLATEQLRQSLPSRVGSWRLQRESPIEETVLKMLQCSAYISRVYEHDQTGDMVAVAVLLGPFGPISVHTPELCYSANNYSVTRERKAVSITDQSGEKHTFWESHLRSNGLEGESLRVIYGWTTNGQWKAAERPRFEFAGVPHLYKLQLVGDLTFQRGGKEFDPCEDFLTSFAVQLRPQLVASSNE